MALTLHVLPIETHFHLIIHPLSACVTSTIGQRVVIAGEYRSAMRLWYCLRISGFAVCKHQPVDAIIFELVIVVGTIFGLLSQCRRALESLGEQL